MNQADSNNAVPTPADARTRILSATEAIIAQSGVAAATTRAVAAEAGVQAPTLYRLFGDKAGLLDAVAEAALLAYVSEKASRMLSSDPVEELRLGWDRHVAFAFAHPAIFAIMEAPRETPAMKRAHEILREKIRAVATSGRLRMPEERALSLFHAAATGIIQVLLRQHPDERDLALSIEAREAALGAITGETTPDVASGPTGAATALNAGLGDIDLLTAGERALLKELLDRIAGS